MKFPWNKYNELPLARRNTLQVFITNKCNLKCEGCFARNVMGEDKQNMSVEEYSRVISDFVNKGGQQINLIGGEPYLHPELLFLIKINVENNLKTTIYTNGYFINKYTEEELMGAKLRVSLYCKSGNTKSVEKLPKTNVPFDVCYMVSSQTTVEEMLDTARELEKNHSCKTFFISSLRELDNPQKEFFYDTEICMPVMKYKELVHDFLNKYEGNLRVDVSKRGVFESTITVPDNQCRFSNYFIGGKIIQCPFDIVNLKFQKDYDFQKRHCQHNSTCLMSKVIYCKTKHT